MGFYNAFILVLLSIPSVSMASGFRIGEQDASAMGKANAVTASVNNISAIYFNPAALTTLKENWVSIGATTIVPSTDYTAPNGRKISKEKQIFYPPNFYIGSSWKEKKLAFGLGVYAPFGLGSKWSVTGPFRYEATYTDLKVLNFNPSVALRLNHFISIGAGLNYEKLHVTFDKQNPWPVFEGSTDGKTNLSGDGTGLGYNFGLLFILTEKLKIGISYRSRVDIDIKGEVKLSNINGVFPLLAFEGEQFTSDVFLSVDLPDILFAGVAYKIFDDLTVSIDIDWTGWSSFKDLQFDYVDERPPFLIDTLVKKNWKDVLAYRLGLEYFFNEYFIIRGGYAFDPSPIPEKTFEPRSPGSDRHQLTIGCGLSFGNFIFDLAYMAVFFEKRNIRNDFGEPITDIDGVYKSFSHLVGASISYRF